MPFKQGDFLLEYVGKLMTKLEAQKMEKKYSHRTRHYMYFFKWKQQELW